MKAILIPIFFLALIAPAGAINWTGAVSTDWNTHGNWSPATIPDASYRVLVPVVSSGRYPEVSTAAGHCSYLTVNAGASITVGAFDLFVSNNAILDGTLNISSSSRLWVGSAVLWNSGSLANITHAEAEIRCMSMSFAVGSNIHFAMGTVVFESSSLGCTIVNLSPSTEFYNIRSSCIGDGYLEITDGVNNEDFAINGYFRNDAGSSSNCSYTGFVTLRGDLIDYNLATSARGISFLSGTLILDGGSQNISLPSAASSLNHLVCDQSGTASLNTDLRMQGNLYIDSGVLDPQGHKLSLGGNWNNVAGVTAFTQAGSTVEFSGAGTSFVYADENFAAVHLNKSVATAGLVIPTGGAVDCDSYDWTQGFLRVQGGLFYARDLEDAGITGQVELISGAIHLVQDEAQYLDLLGALTISGGELHLYGGMTGFTSFFPYLVPGSFTMSAGLLYRHVEGITIPSTTSGLLTSNISGGTIRVGGPFECYQDFSPSGGVLELFGTSDTYLDMNNGSLRNLVINKNPPTRDLAEDQLPRSYLDREGRQRVDTRSGIVSLEANLILNGPLIVQSGSFSLNGCDINCAGNVDVYGVLNVDEYASFYLANARTLTVGNGGRLEVIGTPAAFAKLSSSSGYYSLSVFSGATIAARYGVFEYISGNGILVVYGAFVDPDYAFSDCIFRQGTSGGALLTLNTAQELWIINAMFPPNTWLGACNVKKTVSVGSVNLVNASGEFAGEDWDDDFYNLIDWNTATAAPDLTILNAVWSLPPNPWLGDTRTLTVTIFNNSTTDWNSIVYLDLYANPTAPPLVGEYGNYYIQLTNTFPSFGQITVNLEVANYDAALAGVWNSWLQIDSDNFAPESDESNNTYGPFQITWQPLPPVTDLVIAPDPAIPGNLLLTWSYPLSVTQFRIYVRDEPYGSPFALAGTSTETSFSQPLMDRVFFRVSAQRVEPSKQANPPRERVKW